MSGNHLSILETRRIVLNFQREAGESNCCRRIRPECFRRGQKAMSLPDSVRENRVLLRKGRLEWRVEGGLEAVGALSPPSFLHTELAHCCHKQKVFPDWFRCSRNHTQGS